MTDYHIIHGRWQDVATSFAGKIDHVITDPPYESAMHNAKASARNVRNDGQSWAGGLDFNSIDDHRDEFCQLLATLKPKWFLAFCTSEGVAAWRDAIEAAGLRYKRAGVWHKPDAAPQMNGQGPALHTEHFVTAWCRGGHSHWSAGGHGNHYTCRTKGPWRTRAHPTEKPLPLMERIILDYTRLGDVVLDPFMGSGTTGVACLKNGRKFIGVEEKQKYFSAAQIRLEDNQRRPALFQNLEATA